MKSLLIVLACFCCMFSYGQPDCQADSVKTQHSRLSLDLRLGNITPVQLNLDPVKINKGFRSFYVYRQPGMYEQFQLTSGSTERLKPYKAYYPAGVISIVGADSYKRDSFNPHGSKNIGNALLNGFVNGIIFGNKY